MLFSSISFLYYFLPMTIVIYYLSSDKYKNLVLLINSLLFYFTGESRLCIVLIVSILSAYIHGLLINKYRNSKLKLLFFITSIMMCLGSLVYFKYIDFFIININKIFNVNINLLRVVLPLGISFYTFQILTYLIDVYRNKVMVNKDLISFATYVCLFPQLIAGPIVPYDKVEIQLTKRYHSFDNFGEGVSRFIIGLSKKVIIADNFGLLINILDKINEKSILLYWMYIVAFSLQIYFDFSGYSDMAIGLGKIFGFTFPENFNYPFISKSIGEFWRRWHMTLGNFFRNYLYIPLGGNRVNLPRLILNILIVWALTGFWHGASWNFIIWGLYFAFILIMEKILINKLLNNVPDYIKHIYVIIIVLISFIIFNFENIQDILIFIKSMFGMNHLSFTNKITNYYLSSYLFLFIISIVGSTPLLKNIYFKLKSKSLWGRIFDIVEPVINIVLLIIVTSYMVDGSFSPFLYFRF